MSGPTLKDLFCGAGGSITGMVDAGFEIKLGANHSSRCIETVAANHPDADFLCADINQYDMRRMPRTEVLWASVICTEGSPAGGRRKKRGQGEFDFEAYGHVADATFERTRACALDVVRATEVHRYKAIIVENVCEFGWDWELFDWWVEGMCRIRPGYRFQIVNVSAAHVYSDTNAPAPQWRDRIYIVFTRSDIRRPDLNLRPPSWCPTCEAIVEAEQRWKREGQRIGKYGQQYLYHCPKDGAIAEPLVLPAISAIDLSDIGERIGDRKRPLAPRTMERIAWGIDMFAEPVVAIVAGNTFEAGNYWRAWPALSSPLTARQQTGCDAIACPPLLVNSNHDDIRVRPADLAPMAAATQKIGDGVALTPFVVAGYTGGVERRVKPADLAPLGAVLANGRGHHQLVTPFVTMRRANNRPTSAVDEPLATLATGRHHYLTTPPGAFYIKNFGTRDKPSTMVKSLDEPLGSITSKCHHALVIPYRRTSRPKSVLEPLHTVSTKESAGLLQPAIAVEDCFYRMLKPREHLRAQRFEDSYIVTGNLGEQTMQAGNAVPVNVAHWIGQQLLEVL